MKKLISMGAVAILLASCSHHTYTVGNDTGNASRHVVMGYSSQKNDTKASNKVPIKPTGSDIRPSNIIPNATAFRMNGDYANNVAVTLSPEGELLYFPAPTDITADSAPIELGDGWWLNNQGLGPNSVFTKYTFAEYASLPEVPSPQQLKLSIIPGANVTGFMELPISLNEALQNPEAARKAVAGK